MEKTFADLGFNKQLLNAIAESGYTEPTPIQQKAIPSILSGHDVMGIAQTGTGKTATYVLPVLMKLHYAQGNDPRALILAPTRELAIQISENITNYAKYTDLRQVVLYGGLGPKTQIGLLEKGTDIIVATPGRFLDLYTSGHINIKKLQVMVLDEADKMMDMGFIGAIHRILEILPRKRQNLLFSATMSALVHKIAGDFLEFPTVVEVEQQATPAATIDQSVYFTPNNKTKVNLLAHLLKDTGDIEKLIVFCKTRVVADQIFHFIERRLGPKQVKVIHANKGQNTRINSMNAFKQDEIKVLVATDVAARGIDVSKVSHVINFDVPIIYEDYVHRIGRTGRANQLGVAYTFCTDAELYHLQKIQKLIRQTIPVRELPSEVFVEETGYDERQAMAKEVDNQKRKENPDFKGAFHEKKFKAQLEAKARADAKAKKDKKKDPKAKPKGKAFKVKSK